MQLVGGISCDCNFEMNRKLLGGGGLSKCFTLGYIRCRVVLQSEVTAGLRLPLEKTINPTPISNLF